MATYVLNEEKMFSDIADGIAIVINSETGIYYGMNGFGTAVFENILNGADTEDILAGIRKMPGAPEDAEARLTAFVAALVEKELVMAGHGEGTASLDAEIAQNDDFALEVKEYDDAQELLLADPIHEVKAETGWQPEKEALETDEEVVKARTAKMEEN
ncbi:MAG: PqqD family protein [Desulfovibrio sp.]|jgi:hypothetical protein|nr:PqqD family protein [Desulfovibrio sp.]